jgi:hypothetical protein
MVWQTLEAKLSTPRMNRYLKGYQGKQDLAAQAYVHNMRLAESLVSVFHVLEVGLRNGIQREMAREYKRDDWYEELNNTGNADLQGSYTKVNEAHSTLKKRGVKVTPDDIVAELSFGFWTTLFNRGAFPAISKPLMRVFHFSPKSTKPDLIRSRLNKARDLRNRCFHHEPLLWQPLFELHRDITEVIKWIDPDLCTWIKGHDRLPATLIDWQNWRAEASKAKDVPAIEQNKGEDHATEKASQEVDSKHTQATPEIAINKPESQSEAKSDIAARPVLKLKRSQPPAGN